MNCVYDYIAIVLSCWYTSNIISPSVSMRFRLLLLAFAVIVICGIGVQPLNTFADLPENPGSNSSSSMSVSSLSSSGESSAGSPTGEACAQYPVSLPTEIDPFYDDVNECDTTGNVTAPWYCEEVSPCLGSGRLPPPAEEITLTESARESDRYNNNFEWYYRERVVPSILTRWKDANGQVTREEVTYTVIVTTRVTLAEPTQAQMQARFPGVLALIENQRRNHTPQSHSLRRITSMITYEMVISPNTTVDVRQTFYEFRMIHTYQP